MPAPSKIYPRDFRLETVIAEMRDKGTIKVPHFQRDYVWERTRVAKLFDSIYNGFPIGSITLWFAPPEFRHLYKNLPALEFPEPGQMDPVKMILDGQQRLTSLYVAAFGLKVAEADKAPKDFKKICFDLENKVFLVAKRSEDRKTTISVWRLFSSRGYQEIYDTLPSDKRDSLSDCRDRVLQYPLSVIEVQDMHLEDAIVIFERINQGGKKLNLFDLIVASTWTPTFNLKDKVNDFNLSINSHFGKISDEEVFTQLIALLAKGQCTRSVQLQLNSSEVSQNWPIAAKGLKLAIDFAKGNLGIKIYDFVPYPSMLAMIGYVFAKLSEPALSAKLREVLVLWFWQTAFSQRYGSSTPTLMTSDRVQFLDPWLANNYLKPKFPIVLTTEDLKKLEIKTRSAVRNSIFCLLALREPKHFRNNTAVSLDYAICSDYNAPQKHHIFPKAFLKLTGVKHRNLLMNFAFIPAELNLLISDSKPSDYFTEFKNENEQGLDETLKSHYIDSGTEAPIWRDDYDQFIELRARAMAKVIESVVQQKIASN